MNPLSRTYRAFRSITYEPISVNGFFIPESPGIDTHTRFFSDGEWSNIYYHGEAFAMRAHWLVAWITFRIVRKFWKNRRIHENKNSDRG
jgi:hypothetical protein